MPSNSARERVAAIDLGTNTALLLVAQRAADGGLEVVEDECETCRLGEGLARSGELAPHAEERTLRVLARFLERTRALQVPEARLRAVGTAVLRRAANAGAFIDRAKSALGLTIEVLPEEEEARLGHLAVTADGGSQRTLVIDAGGGSTELVGDAGRLRLSAPIGAVVLTESYLGMDARAPIEAGGWDALLTAIERECERFPAAAALGDSAESEVVLLGGSASNLASVELGLERFDPHAVQGHRMPAVTAAREARRLAALSIEARCALPIEASRAEILPAGLACYAGVLERIGARSVLVSGRGLRYGVARELLTN